MKKKVCVLLCGFAATSLLFTGCGSSTTESESTWREETEATEESKAPGENENNMDASDGDKADPAESLDQEEEDSKKMGRISALSEDSITIEAMANDLPAKGKPDGVPQGAASDQKPGDMMKEAPSDPGTGAPSQETASDQRAGNKTQDKASNDEKSGKAPKNVSKGDKPEEGKKTDAAKQLTFAITDATIIYSEAGEEIPYEDLAVGTLVFIEMDDADNALTITVAPARDENMQKESKETENAAQKDLTETETESDENE